MLFTTVLIGFAAIASAGPISRRGDLRTSKGFTLVVNVTDPTRDLTPSVQGRFVAARHILASLSRAVSTSDYADIFYQNGTEEDRKYRHGWIQTELGENTAGITVDFSDSPISKYNIDIDFGTGTKGIMISEKTKYPFVNPFEEADPLGTFLVCNETIAMVSRDDSERYLTIDWMEIFKSSLPDGSMDFSDVPKECTPVTLLPQCASLPELPEGSRASHEFAQEVRCFDDVSAVEWS